MNKKKIPKLRKKLASLRARPANIKRAEMAAFAKSVGRKKDDRGKEPTFISTLLPNHAPISIPGHQGTLKRLTAGNILDALEADIEALSEMLSTKKESNNED